MARRRRDRATTAKTTARVGRATTAQRLRNDGASRSRNDRTATAQQRHESAVRRRRDEHHDRDYDRDHGHEAAGDEAAAEGRAVGGDGNGDGAAGMAMVPRECIPIPNPHHVTSPIGLLFSGLMGVQSYRTDAILIHPTACMYAQEEKNGDSFSLGHSWPRHSHHLPQRCDGAKPSCQQCVRAKKQDLCEYDHGKGKTRTQLLHPAHCVGTPCCPTRPQSIQSSHKTYDAVFRDWVVSL
ncbi:hypothetical protein EDB84DRAFT_1603425 [Lactarius hengduanensis]|nr:hypothetical protein EDB84DRAFT_1603425 [Lactarius hengduanensis]